MALVIPTASTLFPSATWWQTLANSITADINAARAEALAKSATSGTLASGAVVSSTMAPGLYAAPSVAGITGLPTGAGPGGLLVTPAMMRYVEEGAGGRWWERKKDGTVWLGWARAKATKLVPHALTRPQAATTETQTSRSVRIPFQVPVRARRWRVTIRNANYRTNTAYPGAVTLDTLVIGSAKRDEAGALTSSFAPSVTFPSGNRVLTRATAVADLGAGYTFSNGVDLLEPGVDYMLAFGYTTTGQDVHLGMGGGWWTLGKPGNAELTNDATALLQPRMPFDVRLELLTDDDLPVDVVIGDSISAGSNATLPVHQAPARYMGRNAGRATALHTFGGAAFSEWIGTNWGDATSMKWLDVTAYGRADRAVVALGSNDINSGTDLTTLQANFRALVALVRERVSPNVVACTVTPRTAWTGTAKETLRQAFNSWLRAFPEGIVAVADLAAAVEDAAGTAPRSDFVATDGIHFNTAGSTALGAALAGAASAGGKGPKGDKGDKGDPGGSDAATATYIKTGPETQAAGDARWQRSLGALSPAAYGLAGNGTTDDTTALNSLLADAQGQTTLMSGTYKATGNLPNLHAARLRGKGRIVRDGITFYLDPTGSQTNTIHVSPTGDDTNDGITPALAKRTLQAAFNLLANYGPVLAGKWVIQLAAGTHTLTSSAALSIQSLNRVTIQGPAVSYGVPTAIISGNNDPNVGIALILTGTYARLADVKIINVNPGTASGTGFQAQDFSDVWLDNVHVDGCSFIGAYVMSNSKLRLTGGIYENCQRAVRLYANSTYSIGYNSATHRPIFRNCTIGLEARDMSAGRIDYVDISNCEIGAWAYQGARLHPVSCTFTNCTKAGVYVSAGGQWYNDPDLPSTFTGNNVNVSTGAASSETAWSQAPSEVYLGSTKAPASLTGTTTPTTIATLASVPVKSMNEAGSQLIFRASGVFSGAGDKSVTIRVNGTSIGTFTSSTGSLKTFTLEARMVATAGNAQTVVWRGFEHGIANPFVFKATTTIPFAPNLLASVVLQGTLTNAAGSIEITQASYSYLPVSHLW